MSPLAWFVMMVLIGIAILFMMAIGKFFDDRSAQRKRWDEEQEQYEAEDELRAD